MPPNHCQGELRDEKDYRSVVVAKGVGEPRVYADDVGVGNLMTGMTVYRVYVPDWWARSYDDYVTFVDCLQTLYKDNVIEATRLVRCLSGMKLMSCKEYVEYLCK